MNAATITQNVQNIAIASQGVKDVLNRKTEIQIWAEDKIAEAVANEIQDNGYDSDTFIFDLELSDSLSAEVRGSYIINGYTEDDYYNGTGAFVATDTIINVDGVDFFTYEEDGSVRDKEIPVSLTDIENKVRLML